MSEASQWHVSGEYFESCSCDYLCPCVPSNLAAEPTKGYCNVGLVFHINHGHHGDVTLDGLNFVVVAHTPGIMGEGNWTVGLIVDEKADSTQTESIVGIASGQAGGPMAALGGLISDFKGVESRPIHFSMDGLSRSVSVPGMVEQSIDAVPSAVAEGEPLYIGNTLHPANPQLALAHASDSHIHAFSIDWDETSGKNNGHFAKFDWHG